MTFPNDRNFRLIVIPFPLKGIKMVSITTLFHPTPIINLDYGRVSEYNLKWVADKNSFPCFIDKTKGKEMENVMQSLH